MTAPSEVRRNRVNGCCLSKDHCVGMDSADYVKKLLQETLALRSVCRNSLVKLGKKKAWVPDFIGNLLPACNGVHFTPHGYEKIADTVVKVCKTHLEKLDSAASLVSAGPVSVKPKTFYWLRPSAHVSAYKASHPGSNGKWRAKPTNVGKNATTPSGGRTAPPYYRRN